MISLPLPLLRLFTLSLFLIGRLNERRLYARLGARLRTGARRRLYRLNAMVE